MSNEETTTEAPKTVTTFGSIDRETTNQVRYSTGWGVVYVPKTQLAKLTGNANSFPENIKLTVAVQQDA